MAARVGGAAALLALHRLIAHVEADPEGFVFQRLPPRLQALVRRHVKHPFNFSVDVARAVALPLLQPGHLRGIGHKTITLADASLDVLRPPTPGVAPVLVFVHGGVWTLGNRVQYRAVGQRIAAEGFVSVVVGYDTWPEAHCVRQVHAVRAALDHVLGHAAEWGGDVSRVYVSGHSSGANVSALALLQGPCEGRPMCAGLIGLAGVYDLVEHYAWETQRGVQAVSMMAPACDPLADFSPTTLVRADTEVRARVRGPDRRAPLACARTLLLHGERDLIVPPSSSASFALALRDAGAHVEYAPLRTDDHNSFLIKMALGRHTDAVGHIRRFCGLPPTARL